jgi:glucose-6-phosphate isomerase
MLMETPPGETRAVPMTPQTVVYVPPHWIHRSVDTGLKVLVTFFCYPADSGQGYEIIARTRGMKVLIVDEHAGGWREMPNPQYQSRSERKSRIGGVPTSANMRFPRREAGNKKGWPAF